MFEMPYPLIINVYISNSLSNFISLQANEVFTFDSKYNKSEIRQLL